MTERKLLDSLSNLERVVSNLERALAVPRDRELVFEGTIHRFEMTIELMWKTLSRALAYEGVAAKTPRESLTRAFSLGWLHDEGIWLDMVQNRNTTSHEYLAEELAEDNYDDIAKVAPLLRATNDLLQSKYSALKPR
ncbi:nucleotidyltransferase substrate binding protein [Mesorhizobium sp. BR1-1-3]|uniref:HI0074 family nucleotidyltransferase substrate-binding subunit n=1 Tax=Mesorhizobium sp. BR1-1-3 TaxID=2876651 RepID=UPI001CD11CD9|nr:HI0074 family nucleotidyltransferase substrate-binding subunit [Mesorhizobium sp. BR1-1-3]MBZ9887314.1 nucleotidyltransferase substrate binding protein [Mesorhizobium sp. BR1-1-3]